MSYLTELTLDDGIHKQVKDIEASHYLGTASSDITGGAMASNYSINVSGIVYALNPTNSQKQLSNNDMVASPNGLFIANVIKDSTNTGSWKEIANISNNLVTEINVDDASTIPTDSTVANISTTGSLSGEDAYNKTTNPIATKLYVDGAISNLLEPMVFTGSVTLTADSTDTSKCIITVSKPSSSSAIKKGFTYKITNISSSPKYTGTLVMGDTLIASKDSPNVSSAWVEDVDWTIVPSGDETGFVVGLPSGSTENNIVTWGADGYNIKNSGISIETTLSVNSDTAIPTSKAIATYATGLINGLDATGNSNISASKTIATWSETDGIISITLQDISISSAQVSSMGNYSKPSVTSAIETTDTLNQAIGKLEAGLDGKQNTFSSTNLLNPAYVNYNSTHRAVSDTEKTAWNGKQSALSSTQLNAVNSGIDSTKVGQISANQSEIARLVDDKPKNILNITKQSIKTLNTVGTWNGDTYTRTDNDNNISITVNDDMSLTINGTTENRANFYLKNSGLQGLQGFVLSGGNTNSDTISVLLQMQENPWTNVAQDFGTGVEIPNYDDTKQFALSINISAGTVANNVVIKPMLCTKNSWSFSHEFVPYAPSNAELYRMFLASQS